jgi:hypothetical protein
MLFCWLCLLDLVRVGLGLGLAWALQQGWRLIVGRVHRHLRWVGSSSLKNRFAWRAPAILLSDFAEKDAVFNVLYRVRSGCPSLLRNKFGMLLPIVCYSFFLSGSFQVRGGCC